MSQIIRRSVVALVIGAASVVSMGQAYAAPASQTGVSQFERSWFERAAQNGDGGN
jgi:hypothetical protein